MKKSLLALALAGLYAGSANAAAPSVEEMWEIIQQQQAEIARLKGAQEATDEKVEAAVDAVENGPIANVAEWVNKTSIGGYGEVHLNQLEGKNGATDKNEIDIHRFVLFVGHEFTDDVRFFSEFEIEHAVAGEGKNGEVEVEQAFVEWDLNDSNSAKAGVFLIPVGILNETHEPDTFYGVERNLVESEIIPATWWEGGLGLSGQLTDGLSYDLAVHSGLSIPTTGSSAARVRSGRQKASEATADNYAYTARLKYTGIPGLELAATAQYQEDVLQGRGAAENVNATLLEAHAIYTTGPFSVRALYATWDFDDAINAATGRTNVDDRDGFYIEPSYKITENLGIFARYSEYDEARSAHATDKEFTRTDFGLNYWLTETVVLKADYQNEDAGNTGRDERDGYNLGVGWSF